MKTLLRAAGRTEQTHARFLFGEPRPDIFSRRQGIRPQVSLHGGIRLGTRPAAKLFYALIGLRSKTSAGGSQSQITIAVVSALDVESAAKAIIARVAPNHWIMIGVPQAFQANPVSQGQLVSDPDRYQEPGAPDEFSYQAAGLGLDELLALPGLGTKKTNVSVLSHLISAVTQTLP
jgi:hypothetical protein